MKHYSLADHLMEKLTNQNDITKDEKRALYSAWGRIILQCGDIFGAEQKFTEASRMRESYVFDFIFKLKLTSLICSHLCCYIYILSLLIRILCYCYIILMSFTRFY